MEYLKIFFHFITSFWFTLRNSFRKPVTIQYPFERPKIPTGWRGREIVRDDTCISCARCMMVCPVEAIDMYHPETGAIANTPAEIAKLPPFEYKSLKHPSTDLSPSKLPSAEAEKYLKADTNVKAPPEEWTHYKKL